MGDDFLRLLLCRHVFSACVLRVHRSFRGRSGFHPSSQPNLPELDIIENPTLQRYALDLAAQLDVRHLFVDCGEVDWRLLRYHSQERLHYFPRYSSVNHMGAGSEVMRPHHMDYQEVAASRDPRRSAAAGASAATASNRYYQHRYNVDQYEDPYSLGSSRSLPPRFF